MPTDQPDWLKPALTTLLPSAVIPIVLAALLWALGDDTAWENQPVHALMEGVGAFAAILLALFILLMRRGGQLGPAYIWVATALAGMGFLDGFHAGMAPGPEFIWLHSVATVVGGITFALVALPDRLTSHPALDRAPALMAVASSALGIAAVLVPEVIPRMTRDGHFSLTAELLHLAGGAGFLVAWFHFAFHKTGRDRRERLLLANHCLLFGVAALLFHYSNLWDATWWLWHVLRLLAYLVLLWLFLGFYNAGIRRLRANQIVLRKRGDELERVRRRLGDIIANSPAAITLKDTEGRFVLVNRRFQDYFGLAAKLAVGKTLAELSPAAVSEAGLTAERAALVHGLTSEYEETLSTSVGQRTFLSACFPLGADDIGGIYGVGCIQTDISERKAMEERLGLARRIIENTSEGVVVTTPDGRIVDINDAHARITGYSREELLGRNPRVYQSGRHDRDFYRAMWQRLIQDGHWEGELWDRRKNGEVFPKRLAINAIRDGQGNTTHYVGIFTDISTEKADETKLKNLAFYDPLTSLPNRVFFRERLEDALTLGKRNGERVALMFIDLDRFKDVNDTLGHYAGDELIVQASRRIRACLRKTDTVARLGGDEFTVILSGLTDESFAARLAQNVIDRLQQRFHLFGTEVFIGASIGISLYPDDGEDSETLIKNADTAMYHAKENGRGHYQFFRTEMNRRMVRRVSLERSLRHALEAGELVLYYQPKYRLASGRLVGAEALVRWERPDEGLVSPAEFIPLAEETNLILPLGAWVLQTACQQAKQWHGQTIDPLRIAVNLSPRQFQQRDLLQQISDTLVKTGLPPDCLELEITEGVLMHDPEAATALLAKIRTLGVHIAIDDFGTGYSSLAYLKKFPIDALKIDRSFVRDLPQGSDDAMIVESIIALANSLGIGVVAEGVETQAQRDFLLSRQCLDAQGYLFGRPMPAADFSRILQVRTAPAAGET